MEDAARRLALARRINRLEFREGADAGWFKVAPVAELTDEVTGRHAEALRHYGSEPNRAAWDLQVLEGLIRDWLCFHLPESVFSMHPDAPRLVDRDIALASVDQIIAASLAEPKPTIGGCIEWMEPATPDERQDVPYPQLRVWFGALFRDHCRFYVDGDPDRHPTPKVYAFAPDMIGLMWFE